MRMYNGDHASCQGGTHSLTLTHSHSHTHTHTHTLTHSHSVQASCQGAIIRVGLSLLSEATLSLPRSLSSVAGERLSLHLSGWD